MPYKLASSISRVEDSTILKMGAGSSLDMLVPVIETTQLPHLRLPSS
jgi:hypothetical protein